MDKKGLTISIIFESNSANYGEGLGNVTSLKKITRGDGESYSYISRQALRYNIVDQMETNNTPLALDKKVIQFAPEATIKDFPEIDFFGYMKTTKISPATRSAVVRLSDAISLETYDGDMDFLTNKGLFDRAKKQGLKLDGGESLAGGNIAQSEIHRSYYSYTISADLEKIGIDENYNISLDNTEKLDRIKKLLNTIKFLYRDIRGRREDLKPLFIIGGVYDVKNPFFENRIKINKNKINVAPIIDILEMAGEEIKNNTLAGLISGVFSNEEELKKVIPNCVDMKTFFNDLTKKLEIYYSTN